jgi:hypothetical protein
MRLTHQMVRFGRQLIIAGTIAIVLGLLILLLGGIGNELRWSDLGLMALFALLICGGIYLYQRGIYWRSLRRRLMAADLVTEAPTNSLKALPLWVWGVWFMVALSLAYSLAPFAIFFGSMLIGYGLSSPLLARHVADLEAGRVEFYSIRDPKTRRPTVVRVVPDSALESVEHD